MSFLKFDCDVANRKVAVSRGMFYLFEDRIFLPGPVPVPPPDAEEDDPHADGHHARQQDQLHPVDHVERVHVD